MNPVLIISVIIIVIILLISVYLWISQPGNPRFWTPTQISDIAILSFVESMALCEGNTSNANNATNCFVEYVANRYKYNDIISCFPNCNETMQNKYKSCLKNNGCTNTTL